MVEIGDETQSYWNQMARFYWMTGAPLRPGPEDILHLQQLVARASSELPRGPLHAVMLGVTPAKASMQWPNNVRLLAVDRSLPMVKSVWPGDVPGARQAICGDWFSLPLADRSCSLFTGDGSGNCVRFPEGLRELAAEAARVLHPEGRLLLRCYIQPERREEPDRVLASLRESDNPTFHHFKFRLLMALQRTARDGVVLADVHRYWVRSRIIPERLAEATGWDLASIRMMDAYRDSPTVHVFPTLAEFRSVLEEFFEECSCTSASYPLAERCPVLMLKPKSRRTSENRGRALSCP